MKRLYVLIFAIAILLSACDPAGEIRTAAIEHNPFSDGWSSWVMPHIECNPDKAILGCP